MPPARLKRPRLTHWWRWVAGIAAAGLALRVTFVLGWHLHDGQHIGGDSYYYHYGANLLADGKGFIQPYDYRLNHRIVPAAEHPPLYIIYLAITSLLGMTSYLIHQLWSCLLGASTVVIVGLTARRVIGPRAGLIAAAVVAVYPNFWLNDATVMSETAAQATSALVILLAYAFWQRPRMRSALWLGVAIALAAYSRAESVALVGVMLMPLALGLKRLPVKRRIGLLLASGAMTGLVLAPWVAYNMARFEYPVTISSGMDPTLLSANCDATWYGPLRGYWSMQNCVFPYAQMREEMLQHGVDLSAVGKAYRTTAIKYIEAHASDLPQVIVAREGRTWGFYRPWQTPTLDMIEDRPYWVSWVGLGTLWGIEVAAISGAVVLYRRRTTIIPLVAPLVIASIATAMAFGQTRYRATAEPALVLLAVAGIDALLTRMKDRRPATATDLEPPPDPDTAPKEMAGV